MYCRHAVCKLRCHLCTLPRCTLTTASIVIIRICLIALCNIICVSEKSSVELMFMFLRKIVYLVGWLHDSVSLWITFIDCLLFWDVVLMFAYPTDAELAPLLLLVRVRHPCLEIKHVLGRSKSEMLLSC